MSSLKSKTPWSTSSEKSCILLIPWYYYKMGDTGSTSSGDLPTKYKPGTDLMSKLMFDDKRINDIIVSEHALGQNVSKPTEWLDFTKSDVLYTASTGRILNSMPPVLVEIQYTGNMAFYRCLINYSLSVMKRHSETPVILAIVIHNTMAELTNLTTTSEKQPFLLDLPCHGWAESCYLLNAPSISGHLQHGQSITVEDLQEINDECTKAKRYLLEDVSNPNSRNRTLDCLDNILLKINELKINPTRSIPPNSADDSVIKDWDIVDKYYRDHEAKELVVEANQGDYHHKVML
ncbi:hypothetical protein INT45_010425 [Circinella minor]|uniref:Uncharacterized protein n=1 Tax=Circinella minor TaxID=1195481 RepID=A0A8H7VCJ3_9FUNG|nr:hypothetical protein INT45_010425 [Circinella minor]